MEEYINEEYVREVPGAKTAVVFIHGILSTPRFFEHLVAMVPESFTVHNVLLDGHGGTVRDFSETSMKVWKHQIKYLVNRLQKTHDNIILVGHSMGTLFSIQNAVRLPEKVKALFLLCSPLKVRLHPRSAKYSLRIIFEKTEGSDAIESSARKWYSIRPDKNLWKYIPWVPKFTALLTEIRKTRKLVASITSPTHVFHAEHDSLVSKKAVKPFLKNDRIAVDVLASSYHQYFSEEDDKIITSAFSDLMKNAEKNENSFE